MIYAIVQYHIYLYKDTHTHTVYIYNIYTHSLHASTSKSCLYVFPDWPKRVKDEPTETVEQRSTVTGPWRRRRGGKLSDLLLINSMQLFE